MGSYPEYTLQGCSPDSAMPLQHSYSLTDMPEISIEGHYRKPSPWSAPNYPLLTAPSCAGTTDLMLRGKGPQALPGIAEPEGLQGALYLWLLYPPCKGPSALPGMILAEGQQCAVTTGVGRSYAKDPPRSHV